MMEYQHRPPVLALAITTAVLFCITLVFNYLSAVPGTGLFQNSTGDISDYYYTDITPAGWTFTIWAFIYVWQAAWIVYALTTSCRKTESGFLYVSPQHLPPSMYILFCLNLLCNIAWLFLWDRFFPQYAFMFLFLASITGNLALGVSCIRLYQTGPILIRLGQKKDIWLTRILVQNGLAFYSVWLDIATLLNLNVVLIYNGGVDIGVAGTVCLSILLFEIIAWFFIETFIYDDYFRYVGSPYITLIVGITGSIVNNWSITSSNSALSAFALAFTVAAALIKIAVVVYRHIKKPMFTSAETFFETQKDYGAVTTGYNGTE